jgi:hypothetical protein
MHALALTVGVHGRKIQGKVNSFVMNSEKMITDICVAGLGGKGSLGPLNGHHDVSPVNDSHCEMDSSLLSHSTTSRNLKQLIFCHSSEILRKAITKPYENTEPHTTYLHLLHTQTCPPCAPSAPRSRHHKPTPLRRASSPPTTTVHRCYGCPTRMTKTETR